KTINEANEPSAHALSERLTALRLVGPGQRLRHSLCSGILALKLEEDIACASEPRAVGDGRWPLASMDLLYLRVQTPHSLADVAGFNTSLLRHAENRDDDDHRSQRASVQS